MSTPASDSPRSIHFDIGRVTLHGYSVRERDRFESSLRAALAEMTSNRPELFTPQPDGSWHGSGEPFIPHLNSGTIPAGASPERAARLIASRVLSAAANSIRVARAADTTNASGVAGPAGMPSAMGPAGTVGPAEAGQVTGSSGAIDTTRTTGRSGSATQPTASSPGGSDA